MKLNVFILLVIVSVVSADLYSIAVNVLGMDKLSKMEPSLACGGVDSVQGIEERNKFNETVRCAYSYLNGIPNSIPIETQFEAVLILAAKEDGPMQRLINKTRSQYKLDHYSLKLFLNDTARALLDSASLYGFYKFAFFEEESYAMRRILRGRQVELAKVFNLYESHPVSKQFSFEYVVNQLINPNINLFKCDAFITKFKSAIEGKDDDIFQNEFERFNDLLFNWILNDSALLQNIMSFLEESTPDVSFEFQFKESLFQLTAFHKYREYIDWLIGYLVYIRKADFDHIENTLKLLYGDIASTEWNFLFVFIFSKNLLKNMYWSLSAKRSQECFIDGVNENILYILDMFKSKNLADVATNLILQLNLVNLVEKTHVPSPYRDFPATEQLIRQISDVNDVNIGAINEKVSSIVSDVGAEDAVVARKEIETFVKQNEWITE